MRYQFVQAHQAKHRLTRLCQTLGVSRSGYYAWRRRPASARTRANARLLEQLRQLHRQTKARYGAVKMWHALLAAGVPCGPAIPWRDCGTCMASKRDVRDGSAWWSNSVSLLPLRPTACTRSSWPLR